MISSLEKPMSVASADMDGITGRDGLQNLELLHPVKESSGSVCFTAAPARERPSLFILGTRGIPAAHGGFETFAERFAVHMVTQGWDVTVYCQKAVSPGTGRDGSIDVDTWRGVRRITIAVAGSGARSTVLFDWRCIRHARRLTGVFLVLGYNTACFLPMLRNRAHAVITNMDGIEWRRAKWSFPARAWFFLNERLACFVSTALIADHPEIATHLARHGKNEKITMIPYGADRIENAPTASLQLYGLEPERFVVSIARIEPENSILELVRAFVRRQRSYSMVCVGPFDPEASRYHRRISEAASGAVLFPGAIYDKPTIAALRRHALAYVHGHTVGGTNPSLVEALGAGSAVVAHRNRFNQWTAGPDQFYFSTEDECDRVFQRLSDDADAVNRARSAAVRRYQTAFTWDGILTAYRDLCERLHRVGAAGVLAAFVGLFLVAQLRPAHAEYLLGPGDKLEITVSGSPGRHVTIDADGKISMPQVGSIGLAGLSTTAAEGAIRNRYGSPGSGEEPDVILQVQEYRPFYIDGDVAKPGAYPYHPNMTVREAVALAGGLELVGSRAGESPFFRRVELRRDYETLAIDRLRLRLRQISINAELSGQSKVNFDNVEKASVPAAIFNEFVDAERHEVAQRQDNYTAQIASMQASLNDAQENLNALTALLHLQDNGAKMEQQQVAVTRANVANGAMPQTRIAEVERYLANAQNRYGTTQAQVWTAAVNVSEMKHKLTEAEGSHKAALLREAGETKATLAKIASRIEAVAEEFAVAGGAQSGPSGDRPHISVYRKHDGAVKKRSASFDDDISAGDVVEIYMVPGDVLGLAAARSVRP